jgi:hypothetical protein
MNAALALSEDGAVMNNGKLARRYYFVTKKDIELGWLC